MAENIWQFSDKEIKAESSFFALLDDVQIVLKSAKGKISEHHITKNSEEIPSECPLLIFLQNLTSFLPSTQILKF